MSVYGHMPDGTAVERISLFGGGLSAQVLTYGAVVQDLRLQGHDAPLVLGFPEFAPYLTHSPYFGAIAGRCANRIRDGHFELDGKTYQLDRNFLGKHTLHGGAQGIGKRLWRIVNSAPDRATLAIRAEDGEMGYPGNLDIQVTFALLPGGVLDIEMTATTDAPTLCNLAHHSYFNLDGGATISDHLLQIEADSFLPVDDELIPTGEQRALEGSSFDFRTPCPVSQAHPVDHNYCLSGNRVPLRHIAQLFSRKSGVSMAINTTEPGLQVYDGAKVNIDIPGLSGRSMHACAGIALEPQIWPDANHHTAFPQATLRPGETYNQHTQYVFSKGST